MIIVPHSSVGGQQIVHAVVLCGGEEASWPGQVRMIASNLSMPQSKIGQLTDRPQRARVTKEKHRPRISQKSYAS
jgi:hypothetical protein